MEKRKLIEMGTISRGRSQHRPRNDSKLYGGKYPFIQTGDVKNSNLYIEKYSQTYNDFGLNQSKLWPENTLCITIAANIADTGILSFPACFPDSIIGFTATKGKTDVRYVKYCFDLLQKSIQNMSKGSTQDNLSMEKLEQLEFNCPSFENQQKIAAVLSSLDDKIALNNRINAKLEQMAKRIYDYWFVQFDFPNADGKPYKSYGGKMEYNEVLKREIPAGWEVVQIQEILDNYPSTKRYMTNEYLSEGKYPIIDQDSTKFIAGFINENCNLLTRFPAIVFGDHSTCLKFVNCSFARGADGTQILYSKDKRVKPYYFFWSLKNLTIPNPGYSRHFKFLKELPIIIPSLEIANAFQEIVKPFYEKKSKCDVETQKLTALRDRLLPLLMNGQVEVK